MNFKLLLIFAFLLSSCGVKRPPMEPKENKLPSIVDSYKKKAEKKK